MNLYPEIHSTFTRKLEECTGAYSANLFSRNTQKLQLWNTLHSNQVVSSYEGTGVHLMN